MMKRSQFLEVLKRATARALAFSRQRNDGPALESLCQAGLASPSDTVTTNPILHAVIDSAFLTEDYFALRAAEERAWEHYEEGEKRRGTIHGFAPSVSGQSAVVPSHQPESQASSVPHDEGYGYGV